MKLATRFLYFALALSAVIPLPAAMSQAPDASAPQSSVWKSEEAQHAFGFPEAKPKKKGSLELTADKLSFTNKSVNTFIRRQDITAVSLGNERVELWGTGGMILRMAIPNGGGLAAAAVMHHRVNMLTVDFRDAHGGTHSAVFFIPLKDATSVLPSFLQVPYAADRSEAVGCTANTIQPGSVLVATPNWDKAQVPAAYRALLYEHVIERLAKDPKVSKVYRSGEVTANAACPQYTIRIAVQAFNPGNQILRSATGPVGLFVGTTKMSFNVEYSDAAGTFNATEEIKVAVRDQSESTGVADKVAKSLTKHYDKAIKAQVAKQDTSLSQSPSAKPAVGNALVK